MKPLPSELEPKDEEMSAVQTLIFAAAACTSKDQLTAAEARKVTAQYIAIVGNTYGELEQKRKSWYESLKPDPPG